MKTALLIIDMINALDFPEGKKLKAPAEAAAINILRLKKKFNRNKDPIIYVNDNFGKWVSDWNEVYAGCSDMKSLGRDLSRLMKPEKDDFFILKPKHSAFYCTNLEILLEELKVKKLVITGIAGNICVLFTVNDAHMRGYDIHVPSNCMASNNKRDNNFVIRQLAEVFGIKTAKI